MMKKAAKIMIAILAGSAIPLTAFSADYLLFTPQPLEGKAAVPEKGKGVLVKRITIQPGDTLGKLSRSYSGRSAYFPQILLFNDIKNPNLIYAGKELYVPVSQQETGTGTDIPKPAKKAAAAKSNKQTVDQLPAPTSSKPAPAGKRKQTDAVAGKPAADNSGSKNEQNSYIQALDEYHKGDYSRALKAFSRFLELYPASPLAPDAALYKAECLFKLSGE